MVTIIFDHKILQGIPLQAQASCTQRVLSKIYPRPILAFLLRLQREESENRGTQRACL